jgi:hypothetical protein
VAEPVSLAAGMSRVVRDATLRDTLVRGGRALIPAFSWQRAADEHASLYAQLPT